MANPAMVHNAAQNLKFVLELFDFYKAQYKS